MADGQGDGLRDRWSAAQERHRLRHRPTGFRFAISDGIDFLNGDHWDALTRERSVFTSRAYLRSLESALPVSLSPRYALAYDGDRPAAAIAVQSLDLRAEDTRTGATTGVARLPGVGSLPWKRVLTSRVLACGNMLAWGAHGASFAPGEDPRRLWPAVADVLYRIRRAERLTGRADLVFVKDLGPTDVAGVEGLETFGYRSFESEPDMVLEIPGDPPSMDAYLGALRSKYRKAARGLARSVEKAGLRLERLVNLGPESDRLHELYFDLASRARTQLVTLSPDYLPRLAESLGDSFRCIVLRDGARIAGFVTVIADGDVAVGYYMGFDRELNETVPIYLRLLQVVIEEAASMGCRRVSYGPTALEPKARLGARPVPFRSWTRHRFPAVNAVLRPFLGEVPHDQPPDRSPFKSYGQPGKSDERPGKSDEQPGKSDERPGTPDGGTGATGG